MIRARGTAISFSRRSSKRSLRKFSIKAGIAGLSRRRKRGLRFRPPFVLNNGRSKPPTYPLAPWSRDDDEFFHHDPTRGPDRWKRPFYNNNNLLWCDAHGLLLTVRSSYMIGFLPGNTRKNGTVSFTSLRDQGGVHTSERVSLPPKGLFSAFPGRPTGEKKQERGKKRTLDRGEIWSPLEIDGRLALKSRPGALQTAAESNTGTEVSAWTSRRFFWRKRKGCGGAILKLFLFFFRMGQDGKNSSMGDEPPHSRISTKPKYKSLQENGTFLYCPQAPPDYFFPAANNRSELSSGIEVSERAFGTVDGSSQSMVLAGKRRQRRRVLRSPSNSTRAVREKAWASCRPGIAAS